MKGHEAKGQEGGESLSIDHKPSAGTHAARTLHAESHSMPMLSVPVYPRCSLFAHCLDVRVGVPGSLIPACASKAANQVPHRRPKNKQLEPPPTAGRRQDRQHLDPFLSPNPSDKVSSRRPNLTAILPRLRQPISWRSFKFLFSIPPSSRWCLRFVFPFLVPLEFN